MLKLQSEIEMIHLPVLQKTPIEKGQYVFIDASEKKCMYGYTWYFNNECHSIRGQDVGSTQHLEWPLLRLYKCFLSHLAVLSIQQTLLTKFLQQY